MNEFLQDDLRVFVVPVDILKRDDLSTHEKMTYIVLKSFTNPHSPVAWPSYATIAQLASMSRRMAIKCVQALFEKGLLSKETRFTLTEDKSIRATSNMYTIKSPGVVNTVHQGGEYSSPGVVNTVHQGGEPRAPYHNHLTNQDRTDDDAAAESEIYEMVKTEISKEQFAEIVGRVKKRQPENYKNYLSQAVQREIAKMQAAPSKQTAPAPRSRRQPVSNKPKLPVAAATGKAATTPEELEQIRQLARRIQNDLGN